MAIKRTKKDENEYQDKQALTPVSNLSEDDKRRVAELTEVLKRYQSGKANIDARIIENDRWYRNQHWDLMREKAGKDRDESEPEPTSAYLWNTIANRHGDLMDAFPEPVFTERELSDKQEADNLNKIVKVILERQKFKDTYSRNAWYKVKAGCACYGVFWDQTAENGLGDISVKKIDVLRIYWEQGIEDINDSEYVFLLSMVSTAKLRKLYPNIATSIKEDSNVSFKSYSDTDQNSFEGKSLVVDAYYREMQEDGTTQVHLDKFTGNVMLDSTKKRTNEDGEPSKGLYNHGRYPFIFDSMFPEEHSLLGFGLVDIIKSPQMYIDKLDQILTKNAMIAGKYRLLVKRGGGINVKELADISQEVIEADNVREGEDYAVLQGDALPIAIMQHRGQKINELKEVSGANDFNRGNSGGGITAASAIMALQEAGNKLSRAMISGTYSAYADMCHLIMELIAQYYKESRKFRVTNDDGKEDYIEYDNSGLNDQPLDAVVEGMEPEVRRPILDVTAHAEKYSPYAQLSHNELAKELFGAGFFQPEMVDSALIALDIMSFDGKDVIVQKLNEIKQERDAIQQAQMEAQQQMANNQQIIQQMNQYIKETTGKDMLQGANIGAEQQAGAVQEGM